MYAHLWHNGSFQQLLFKCHDFSWFFWSPYARPASILRCLHVQLLQKNLFLGGGGLCNANLVKLCPSFRCKWQPIWYFFHTKYPNSKHSQNFKQKVTCHMTEGAFHWTLYHLPSPFVRPKFLAIRRLPFHLWHHGSYSSDVDARVTYPPVGLGTTSADIIGVQGVPC